MSRQVSGYSGIMDAERGNLFSLAFMTVWLSLWSMGVGFLSGMVGTDPALWLFILTHGGSEIGVGWWVASTFAHHARHAIRPPKDITIGLDSMEARWGHSWQNGLLLVWFCLLGLLIGALLMGGTWYPTLLDPSPVGTFIALILSAGWGVLGWRWLVTLNTILQSRQTIALKATFDRVTIEQRGPFQITESTINVQGMEIYTDEYQITFLNGETIATVPCPQNDARDRMIEHISAAVQRAEQAPFQQPEVPAALSKMLSQKT